MGRLLVLIGLLVAGAGVLIMLGVPIGRLPGDFVIRRGNGTFYFPLTTSILVSVVLTLVMALFRR
ncbi:MAG TPA: DUF2905 domain-containing protein [Vicinamibacterales bacterium]|nr:DUF2905 domain-containing protein [Vicinamibacterales bacterium]